MSEVKRAWVSVICAFNRLRMLSKRTESVQSLKCWCVHTFVISHTLSIFAGVCHYWWISASRRDFRAVESGRHRRCSLRHISVRRSPVYRPPKPFPGGWGRWRRGELFADGEWRRRHGKWWRTSGTAYQGTARSINFLMCDVIFYRPALLYWFS